MKPPALSVVMPAYNAAEYVKPTIESILQQTFEDFELLIVDDGSTDETFSIVDSFDDERIRTIRLAVNTGIPSARNRGIEEARAEYIACHDSDDRSRPDRFERQVAYLDTHREVAAVGTGAMLVDEDGKNIARRHVFAEPSLLDLLEVNHFVHASMVFRRSALEEVGGYDEWFEIAEDYELILRLADEFDVRNIDEPMYEQQIRTDSAYASRLEEIWLYDLLAVKKVTEPKEWERLKTVADSEGIGAVTNHLSRCERGDYYRKLARELLRYGKPKTARGYARRAIDVSNPKPMPYLLYSLSFAPPTIMKFVVSTYRRLLLNPRLRLANARQGKQNISSGFR